MARPNREQPEVEQRVEAKRPDRVPLGVAKNILTAPVKEGFRRRYINDVKDRIARALKAGYQFVEEKVQVGDNDVTDRNISLGSGAEVVVDRRGTKAILMEIPEEYAREDDELKAKNIDEGERAITDAGKKDGFYGGVDLTGR